MITPKDKLEARKFLASIFPDGLWHDMGRLPFNVEKDILELVDSGVIETSEYHDGQFTGVPSCSFRFLDNDYKIYYYGSNDRQVHLGKVAKFND